MLLSTRNKGDVYRGNRQLIHWHIDNTSHHTQHIDNSKNTFLIWEFNDLAESCIYQKT